MNLLSLVVLTVVLAACAAGPNDLTLVSVERTTFDQLPEPPGERIWTEADAALRRWNEAVGAADRPRILRAVRVRFSSSVNIPRLLDEQGWYVRVETDFCDRLLPYAELSPSDFYIDNWPVGSGADPAFLAHGFVPVDGVYLYDMYVYAQGREANYGPGATQSFNLADQAHDICFNLEGGGVIERFTSNTVRIPSSDIEAVLSRTSK